MYWNAFVRLSYTLSEMTFSQRGALPTWREFSFRTTLIGWLSRNSGPKRALLGVPATASVMAGGWGLQTREAKEAALYTV